jgi:hypothetical protein
LDSVLEVLSVPTSSGAQAVDVEDGVGGGDNDDKEKGKKAVVGSWEGRVVHAAVLPGHLSSSRAGKRKSVAPEDEDSFKGDRPLIGVL